MAFTGRKIFNAGQVLTASDLNSIVDQTVMVFDDTNARDTAIPTPTEGMVVYLISDESISKYDGSNWTNIQLSVSLSPNTVTISDGSGNLTSSAVTTTELNILDGATVTTTELNILDGATVTTTELNRLDNVSSNIQTQLNDKADLDGADFTGRVTADDATEARFSVRNIYITDNDTPSGGVDGDLWVVWE